MAFKHVWDWVDDTYYSFGHWPFDEKVKIFENRWFVVYRCHWRRPSIYYNYDCLLITLREVAPEDSPIHFIVGSFFKPDSLKIEKIDEGVVKVRGEASAEACTAFNYEVILYSKSPLIQFRVSGSITCGDLVDTSGHKFPSLVMTFIEPVGTECTASVYTCKFMPEGKLPYVAEKISDVVRGVDKFIDLPVAQLPCTKIVAVSSKEERKYVCIWQVWSCRNIKRAVLRLKQLATFEKDIGTAQFLFNTGEYWELNFVLGFITEYRDVLRGCFFEHTNELIIDDYRDVEVVVVKKEPFFKFIEVSPRKILVSPGEEASIKYIVKNVGLEVGKVDVRLQHDEKLICSKSYILPPDAEASDVAKFAAPSEKTLIKYMLKAYNINRGKVDDFVEIVVDTTQHWPKFVIEEVKAPSEAIVSQDFTLDVIVRNIGFETGSCVIEVWKGNEKIDIREVTLAKGEVREVTFRLSEEHRGEYVYIIKVLNRYTNDYDDVKKVNVKVLQWWETTIAKIGFAVGGVVTIAGLATGLALMPREEIFEKRREEK